LILLRKFQISKSQILNQYSKPYLIAEIGVNHDCSLRKALSLIDQAKKSGADAVKFQTYKAELIASKNALAYWDMKKEKSKNQYNLFKKYDKFEKEDYFKIFEYCKKNKIEFLSTPFDEYSVDLLDPILKYYKISSSDINNFPLIEKIAKKNKPILLSTGASNIIEIKEALKCIKKYNKKDVAIMHCILNYPTKNKDANLLMINDLKNNFPNNLIGYSDHTLPDKNMINLITAYTLGAIIIEKHFTYDKRKKGNDHYHSMDRIDVKRFVENSNYVYTLLGKNINKKIIPSENISRRNARRSLVLNKNLKKGQRIKISDIICKRPGYGIQPKYLKKIINLKINKNLKQDRILKWSDLYKS
jgi:sialic acid synthase SpsE